MVCGFFLQKKTTSSESIFFSFNIIEKHEFWKGIWEGAYLPALEKIFLRKANVGHRFCSSWYTDDGATYGLQNGPSDLLLWTSEVLEKGDKYGIMALILFICTC